jgi:hypothetical protein
MRQLLLTLPILLSLTACNPAAPSTAAPATNSPQPQVDPAPPANARQAALGTRAELLVGKWRSNDDPSVVLEFDGKNRIEAGTSEPYVLSDHCLNPADADNGIPAEKDAYLSCADSDLCWYIIDLSADQLSLSYMGRGNTLAYTRIR